ncbi:MAG: nucleotide exchange factor GrpE [Clostridiales bacterium]|nr:nucleotide exchange factor GrpE [Candidatus Apopatousia equi]
MAKIRLKRLEDEEEALKKSNHKCECDENCECDCDDECECGCHDEVNYLEMAQRIQAEFDNYRKRTVESEKQARQKGIIDAVEKILPVIDSIENAKRQVSDEVFKKSIDLINVQLYQCLENLGVKKIDALNKPFNPNFHNAIMTGEDKNFEQDIVLEVFQDGFMLNDKVIRHSVVKVNK